MSTTRGKIRIKKEVRSNQSQKMKSRDSKKKKKNPTHQIREDYFSSTSDGCKALQTGLERTQRMEIPNESPVSQTH